MDFLAMASCEIIKATDDGVEPEGKGNISSIGITKAFLILATLA